MSNLLSSVLFPLSRILVALLTVLERFGDLTVSWWDCLRMRFSSVLWWVSNIVCAHVEGYHFTQKQSCCSLYTCGTQRQRYLVCPLHLLSYTFFVHRIHIRFHCRELHTFMGLSLGHIFLSMRMKLIAICLSWELEPPIRLSFISRRLLLQDRILSLMFWNMSRPSHLLRNQSSALIRCGSNSLLHFSVKFHHLINRFFLSQRMLNIAMFPQILKIFFLFFSEANLTMLLY